MYSNEELDGLLGIGDSAPQDPAADQATLPNEYLDSLLFESPAEEVEDGWWENPQQVVRHYLQGASLGFSDELGAGVAAAAAVATGNADSYWDAYNDIHESLSYQRKEWSDEHALAAGIIEAAGSIGTGGAAGARALGTKAVQNAGRLGKAGASVGVGVGEGAAYGFGSSNQGERGEGALVGGLVGGILPAAASGVKAGIDQLPKGLTSIRTKLRSGDEFIPLNIADDGWLGDFYRSVVGSSFGGKKLKEQSAHVVGHYKIAADFAKERLEAARRGVNKQLAITKNKFGKLSEKQEAQLSLDLIKSVDDTEDAFRRAAIMEATPLTVNAGVRGQLASKSPHEAMAYLDNFWANEAFKSVKNSQITIMPPLLIKRLEGVLSDDPTLKTVMRGYVDTLEEIMYDGMKKGRLSGKHALAMRNHLATMANEAPQDGSGALLKAAAGKIKAEMDDVIKSRLPKAARDEYVEELSRWNAMTTLRSAVNKNPNGKFTPSDWLSVVTSKAKSDARKGAGVLQKQALKADESITAANEQAKKSALNIKARKDRSIKTAERQAENNPRLAAAEKAATKKQAKADMAKELSPNDKNSLFVTLFNTGLLGVGAGYKLTNLASGGLIGRGLTSEAAQKTIVGQAPWQAAVADSLDKYAQKAGPVRAAGRAANREITSYLAGDG